MTQDEVRQMIAARGIELPIGPIDMRPGAIIRVPVDSMAMKLAQTMRRFKQ